ncbi:MAG: outer membrane protein assembly factor BamC [Pseudomonadota bacterium]|nr:outer membrane protein assembly factor BamC [Pseudomonadota bacterium]
MIVFISLSIKFIARIKTLLIIACALLLLPGCSWLFGDEGLFPSRAYDYLSVEESRDLVLPDGIELPAIHDQYPIPNISTLQLPSSEFEVPRVQSLDSAEQKGSVKVQKFNQRQWILVNASSGQVWPLVANFLASNQIPVVVSNGNQGVIETDWLKNIRSDEVESSFSSFNVIQSNSNRTSSANVYQSGLEGSRERYRFSLKPGVQKATTEIEITQQATTATTSSTIPSSWGNASSDSKREDNMINLLAEHLADSPNRASYSLLAQGIGSASKVKLLYDNSSEPYLSLSLPFDRAWASLGLALKKANFDISDLNRSRGFYLARSNGSALVKKEKGFISRLFSRSKDEEVTAAETLVFSARQNGSNLIIQVKSQTGSSLDIKEQALILRRVQKKLS